LLFGGFHTYTLEQSLKREQDLVVRLRGMARPGFMRQMQHLLVQGDGDGVQRLVADYNPAAADEAGRFDTDYLATLVARKPTICTGHAGETYGVTFSPDGQTLYSAGADKTVRLWRTATGELVATLVGHADEVNSVCVTPDGRWLFSLDDVGDLRRWDARTGESHGSAAKVGDRGYSLAVSRDAKHLWCIGENTSAKTSYRWSIAPDGLADRSTFASGFESVVPLELGQAIGARNSHGLGTIGAELDSINWINAPGKPSCIDRDPSGCLACGGHTGWLAAVRSDSHEVIASWRAHDDMIESLQFWSKDQVLTSVSRDATVRTWDAVTGAHLDTFATDAACLWCVAISSEAEWLAVAGDPRGPLIWRIADRRARLWNQWTWKPAGSRVSRLAVDRDATTMAMGLADGTIVICDAEHGVEQHRFRASDQQITGLWWSASGKYLAAEGEAGDVSLWHLQGNAAQRVASWNIDGPIQVLLPRQRLCFAGATERLLIGPIANQLRLVDATNGATMATIAKPDQEIHEVVAPSRGGSFILRDSTGKVIGLDDVTLSERFTFQTFRDQQSIGSPREQHTFACSPRGELVATLADQSLHLWSTEHGAMVASIAFDAALVELAFSAKDDLLAVGLADDSIRIVDLATREETLRLPGLIQTWGELGFSANGRSLRCAKLTEVGVRTRIWRVPD
jgi:WD40 repeat protein